MTELAPGGALSDAVLALMRDVAGAALLPRFGRSGIGAQWKAPGELVTDADRESEALLRGGLERLLPGAAFVGEEAASADAGVMARLGDALAWIVDPLDGTGNFAAGRDEFGIMVALAERGRTLAGWIFNPVGAHAYAAARGAGAMADGAALKTKDEDRGAPTVGVSALWGDEAERARAEAALRGAFAPVPLTRCAAVVYPRLAHGALGVAMFRRTLPWDHAAGALLLEEAGGWARRPDGREYRPDHDEEWLVAAGRGAAGRAAWALAEGSRHGG